MLLLLLRSGSRRQSASRSQHVVCACMHGRSLLFVCHLQHLHLLLRVAWRVPELMLVLVWSLLLPLLLHTLNQLLELAKLVWPRRIVGAVHFVQLRQCVRHVVLHRHSDSLGSRERVGSSSSSSSNCCRCCRCCRRGCVDQCHRRRCRWRRSHCVGQRSDRRRRRQRRRSLALESQTFAVETVRHVSAWRLQGRPTRTEQMINSASQQTAPVLAPAAAVAPPVSAR
jgi:hypothetical protein